MCMYTCMYKYLLYAYVCMHVPRKPNKKATHRQYSSIMKRKFSLWKAACIRLRGFIHHWIVDKKKARPGSIDAPHIPQTNHNPEHEHTYTYMTKGCATRSMISFSTRVRSIWCLATRWDLRKTCCCCFFGGGVRAGIELCGVDGWIYCYLYIYIYTMNVYI